MEEEAATTKSGSDPIHHAKENRGLAFAAGDVLFNAMRDFVGDESFCYVTRRENPNSIINLMLLQITLSNFYATACACLHLQPFLNRLDIIIPAPLFLSLIHASTHIILDVPILHSKVFDSHD